MGRSALLLPGLVLAIAGCCSGITEREVCEIAGSNIPRELNKAALPPYRIEPPDVLLIEAVYNIRPSDAPLRAGQQLLIRVSNALPIDTTVEAEDPLSREIELQAKVVLEQAFKVINGLFLIESDGTVDLGPIYGSVAVAGLTIDEAEAAVDGHLRENIGLAKAQVSLTLPDVAGRQPITGEHLVNPDGTVSLGVYGEVFMAGLTLAEAKRTLEAHLAGQIHDPEIRVAVTGFNSKLIYVITDGGGFGEQVIRLPYTGSETVLDAIAQVQGLSDVSSREIWVARPGDPHLGCAQVLPVDWRAITQEGIVATNYQLYPGDRVYIEADKLMELDILLTKVFTPVERVFGVLLLGDGTIDVLEDDTPGGSGFGGFGGLGF
jgi:polysaccharide biosynthesis/export protein